MCIFCYRHHKHKSSSSKSKSSSTSGGSSREVKKDKDSLSVEETNKLRASLGLKPLKWRSCVHIYVCVILLNSLYMWLCVSSKSFYSNSTWRFYAGNKGWLAGSFENSWIVHV
jgi:hypothetical protein